METSVLITSLISLAVTILVLFLLRPVVLWYFRIKETLSYQLKTTIILEQLLQTMNKDYKGEIVIKNKNSNTKQKVKINEFVKTLVDSPEFNSQFTICRVDERIESKETPEKEN